MPEMPLISINRCFLLGIIYEYLKIQTRSEELVAEVKISRLRSCFGVTFNFFSHHRDSDHLLGLIPSFFAYFCT